MNDHVRQFLLIFCVIGAAVCVILAIINGSKQPAAMAGVAIYGTLAVVLIGGIFMFRSRREI